MKIVTSLSFNGQCREAFEIYARVLGGKIVAAFPYDDRAPSKPLKPEQKDWLMHCSLEVGDQALMGADMDVRWAANIEKPKNGFDVCLVAADVVEAKRWFDELSEGGRVTMPFEKTFWSPGYGAFTDKFGIPWMINTDGDPDA